MKRALVVIGAAGGVGSGVVGAAVGAGYHVIADTILRALTENRLVP